MRVDQRRFFHGIHRSGWSYPNKNGEVCDQIKTIKINHPRLCSLRALMKAEKHFDLLPKNGLYINPPAIGLIDHLPESTPKKSQRKTPDNKRNDGNRVYGYGIHSRIFSPCFHYTLLSQELTSPRFCEPRPSVAKDPFALNFYFIGHVFLPIAA